MNNKNKLKLAELNNVSNGKKKKHASEPIWLFIAEMVAETNGNMKWIIWLVGLGFTAGLAVLVTLACRGI